MKALFVAVALIFTITLLGTAFGIIEGHIAVVIYLLLITLAGAASVYAADRSRARGRASSGA